MLDLHAWSFSYCSKGSYSFFTMVSREGDTHFQSSFYSDLHGFDLHHEMVHQGIHPDRMTYNSLIMGCFSEGKVESVKELVNDMSREFPFKADTYNILVEGYCKVQNFSEAYSWCREMLDSSFLPSASTSNELINGLRVEGRLQEAAIISSKTNDMRGIVEFSTHGDLYALAQM